MSLKRIGCGLLAMILSLPLAFPVNSYASNFSDVSGHWAEFYISKVYDEDIIEGYPSGFFLPDKSVTRAEFAVMINKTFELDDIDTSDSVELSDVPYTAWYYEDIAVAIAAGYAGGYSDNTFKPNNPISRQEAAVMLSRLIPEGKEDGKLKKFGDAKQIEDWATDAISKLNGKGYIGAYSDGKLHPDDPLTRGQTAKILSEVLDNEDIITRKTTVDEDDTELADKIYVNDVLIDEDLEDGSATIDNCIILGELIVEGGGNGTVTLNNTRVSKATINKEDSAVRVVAKGTTVVSKLEASESCYLQSSGKDGYGFPDITVTKLSDVTLKGTFPKVSIEGNHATLTLESGEISDFTLTSAGKYSDIILSGKSEITSATVRAECYFHGEGTIVSMLVYSDDVTYETKPDKMTVGLDVDRPEEEGDEDVEVTFKPKNKADDVDVDTEITVTFNTSMTLADGDEIDDGNVNDFLTLHKGSKSGDTVSCEATVNSAKKIITLTPDEDLSEGTKYYIVLADETLENAGGNANDGETVYFTTEGDAEDSTTTSSAVTTPALSNFALTASESSIKVSYTPNVAGTVYVMATTSSISLTSAQIIANNKTATATANTSGSLTLTGLTANTKYYVSAVLRNSSGTSSAIVTSNTTTTISDATLKTLTVAASGGSNLLSGFSSATETYSVTVPSGTTTVDITASTDTSSNTNAVITINGTIGTSLSGIAITSTSGSVTQIKVTISADNKTTNTYTINITVGS